MSILRHIICFKCSNFQAKSIFQAEVLEMFIRGTFSLKKLLLFIICTFDFIDRHQFLLMIFGSRREPDTHLIFCSTALAAFGKCTFSGKFSLDMHLNQHCQMSQTKSATKTSSTQQILTG